MTEDGRSKGGKRRAESLSPEKRSEIAKKAASARWADRKPIDTLRAIATGDRDVNGITFPVYNLNDSRRVLSERGFLAVIGAKGRGVSGGHRLRRILADPIVRNLFSKDVLVAIDHPIEFYNQSDVLTRGYDAEILKDFCVGFVRARELRALNSEVQQRYARYCQMLLIAFADLGVKAWIDEATGYQHVRERDALHKILDKYIAQQWANWSKTFPDEFYQHIYRLKKLPFNPESVARPGFIGHLTSDLVYARLAPGILDELQKKNPVVEDTGRRTRRHHQWLTEEYGHPKLKEHISNLIFMMRGSNQWGTFYRNLQRAAPKLHETAEFDFGEDA